MFEQKREEPVAEVEREGLVERRRPVAPGQKLILIATSGVAALLILFGIASRNNYFGLFGEPAPPKAGIQPEVHPVAAPEVKVPLALGQPASAPPSLIMRPQLRQASSVPVWQDMKGMSATTSALGSARRTAFTW